MINPFILKEDAYQRDLDHLRHYFNQMSLALSKLRGISLDEARAFMRTLVGKDGQYPFYDTQLTHTHRDPVTKDRSVKTSSFRQYLDDAIRNRDIIVPTLTRYLHPEVEESPFVRSIDGNVANRSRNKKQMFAAKMRMEAASKEIREVIAKVVKDDPISEDEKKEITVEEIIPRLDEAQRVQIDALQKEYWAASNLNKYKNQEQTGNKLSNNALSGGHVAGGSILSNKTAHSSLTSTCRITSGFANASNEKLIAGNRHYHSFDVTFNNITSIISISDLDAIDRVMQRHHLHYPTPEETFAMIDRSASQYWRNARQAKLILEYLQKLKPVELAAVMYVGDMYHLRQYNDAFMRRFIGDFSRKVEGRHPDPKPLLKDAHEDFISLINQIQGDDMKGVQFDKIPDDSPLKHNLACTLQNTYDVLETYKDFINVFFASKNVPASLGYFPSSIRHCVLLSDTDSTIFTVQDWVKWYCGSYVMSEEAVRVCSSIVFMTSQATTHILAMMSANIGVERKRLFQIAMKNEFRFDALAITNETKHYYGIIGCREGNVYSEYEQENKGVHLKNSALPGEIMDAASELMLDICKQVAQEGKVSIKRVIERIVTLEHDIQAKIRAGESDYFAYIQIKTAETYTAEPNRSPYYHYMLWDEVFAPKYGKCEAPPYVGLRINTTLNTDRQFRQWLDSFTDQALAERFRQWCSRNGKTKVSSFVLPADVINANGIPEEIFKVIDVRRIIGVNTKVFYKILETLSYPVLDDNNTILLSDYA